MIVAAERVGFGPRLVASIIDAAVVLGGVFVLALLAGRMGAQLGAQSFEMNVVSTVIVLGYFGVEAVTGWTPGKRMRGLMIAVADGRVADGRRLLTRWILKDSGTLLSVIVLLTGLTMLSYLSALVNIVVVVGCFLALGASGQALHDRLAGTAVFRAVAIERLAPGAMAGSRARAVGWMISAGSLLFAGAALLQFAPAGTLRPGVAGWLVVIKLLAVGVLVTGVTLQRRARTAAGTSARPRPGPEGTTEPDAPAPRPEEPAPTVRVSEPPPPMLAPAAVARPAPRETRVCPTCGVAAMERGRVIGWYCTVCGTRAGSA